MYRSSDRPRCQVAESLGISDGSLAAQVKEVDACEEPGALDADERAELAQLRKEKVELGWGRVKNQLQLEFVISYDYDGDMGDLRLASGSVETAHADFFNAWEPDKLASEVQYCINRDAYCSAALADVDGPQARTASGE